MVDEGLKDVTYHLEDGVFVCTSVRPSPGSAFVVEDEGWGKVIDEVIRGAEHAPSATGPDVSMQLDLITGQPGRAPYPAGGRRRSAGPGTVALGEARARWTDPLGRGQMTRASSANASASRETDGTSVPSS